MKISVLAYHKVDDYYYSENWITINKFKEHLEIIKKYNYTPLFLDDIYKNNLLDNSIVITFDDGYENFYTKAYPILKEYNFKATNFISTNFISYNENTRHYNTEWEKNKIEINFPVKHLIWEEIQLMKDDGFKFECHTKSHSDLTMLSLNDIETEIAISKKIIEKNLQEPVYFFSAPYARYNKDVENVILKYGFHGAVKSSKYKFSTKNIIGINRIAMNMNTNVEELFKT